MKKYILMSIYLFILFLIGIFSTYLFVGAPCQIVKQYWYLTNVPGRCL